MTRQTVVLAVVSFMTVGSIARPLTGLLEPAGPEQTVVGAPAGREEKRWPLAAGVPILDPPPGVTVDTASRRRPTVADPTASLSAFDVIRVSGTYRSCLEDERRPKGLADLDGGYKIFYYSLAEDSAIQLSVIPAGSASRTKRSIVQVYRFLQYAERPCDLDGRRTPVVWGVGAQAVLHVRNAKKGINLSKLSMLAAAVEFNRAEVAFSMDTPGITGSAVRSVLPEAGAFHVDNYAKMVSAIDQVRQLLDDPSVTIRPQLLLPLGGVP